MEKGMAGTEEQTSVGEPLDLAALGKTWTPPQASGSTPEVSEILAEMPWWAARGLLYIIVAFLLAAGLWAHFSVLDIVSEARGTLLPEGYTRRVEAQTDGVVQFILVREGDRVEANEALVQLDSAEARVRRDNARQEMRTLEEQLLQIRASGAPVVEALEKENALARLESEIAALDLALARSTIRSPVDGLVTSLEVRTPGAVVKPGDPIATVAPANARLVVEGKMPNQRIAFVRKGLPAKLKFDAFPFQDYGVVNGTVIDVSPDAQSDEKLGSVYKVTVAPDRPVIAAHGQEFPLRPGMTATMEVVTERKSVLSLFAAPFKKAQGDLGSAK
jgi:multidrug efflux pump subunit AcrA (membrane-fusion protein)